MMRIVAVVAVVFAVAAAVAVAYPTELEGEFREWMAEHGKTYESEAKFAERLQVYADNKVYIAGLNAKHPGKFAMNVFGDVTPKEFREQYLGTAPDLNVADYPVMKVDPAGVVGLPDSVDWRTHNPPVVNPVKNQGQCGSCWAFSAVSALESAWALAGNKLVSLSESQLVDCDHTCTMYHGEKSCNAGCNGGLQSSAYNYLIEVGGSESEDAYPYVPADGTCTFDKSKVAATMTNWTFVSNYENPSVEALLQTVATKGPVAIAVDASSWQFIGGDFIIDDAICGSSLDHGVVLEGYTTTKSLLGKDRLVYIVRNSWGASWGREGYVYLELSKGDSLSGDLLGTCGIDMYATLPIV